MSILIICPGKDPKAWKSALESCAPDQKIEVYPDVRNPEKVEMAVSWRHPPGVFQQFPRLKLIASMGAGVDHILQDQELPAGIPVTRVTHPNLSQDMAVFVLSLILEHIRNLSDHHSSKEWTPRPYQRPQDIQVGIMGLGELGRATADLLLSNGFRISGWSRTRKSVEGVEPFSGSSELKPFLTSCQVLVCLLPLTSDTENILNKQVFWNLPKGAFVINVARGKHLVEEDLLEAIHKGHLSGAALDVFRQEPLPVSHALRREPKIKISPHVASITDPFAVAPQLVANFRRCLEGKPLENVIDLKKQY